MKLVIGLVGRKRAGKGTLVSILRDLIPRKTFYHFRTNVLLKQACRLFYLEPTRVNLQNMFIALADTWGEATIVDAYKKKMLASEADIVFYDRVCTQSDYDLVRSFPNNIILAVSAKPEIRFERGRSVARTSKSKTDEKRVTQADFNKNEKVLTERLIDVLYDKADGRFTNDSTRKELKDQVKKWLSTHPL